jgi:uncharacterized protein (TIGR02118 family)
MLLEKLPGLRKKGVNHVYSAPGGLAHFGASIEIYFDDRAALEAALISPQGIASGQLLLDFAGPNAITLFADVMEEDFSNTIRPPA